MSEHEVETAARRWWRYAREDLAAATEMAEGEVGTARHVCLFAQQAAEKAIKAVLVFFQIEHPRTHDLDRLKSLLPDSSRKRMDGIDLAELSEWAVESRYPGDWPDLGSADAKRGVLAAKAVVGALSNVIE